MRKTIKSKLVLEIVSVILVTMIIGLIGIYCVIDNREEEYIKEDIGKIADFSKNYIYTSKVLGDDKNSYKIVNTIGELFNIYVYIEIGEENIYYGNSNINDVIEELILEADKTKAMLNINCKDKLSIGTLYQPIYIDGEFYGYLILQKDYSKIHGLNQYILIGIGIILAIILIVLVMLVYLIIRGITNPLEELTRAIKSFGRGEKIGELEVKTEDEIGELTLEFNNMKKNILDLQDSFKEFFSNATHELKTPLTVIKGYAQLLQEEEYKEEYILNMLNSIEDETIKMNSLVNKILNIEKEDSKINYNKEVLSLKDIIEEILKLFSVIIEDKRKKIILDLEDILIVGIKEDVRILISNLIDNSLKYSDDEEIKITLDFNKELRITNTCSSINKDIKYKLLDPFIKGNTIKHKDSTGLGLYMCKRISEKNGYQISYEIKESIISFNIKF